MTELLTEPDTEAQALRALPWRHETQLERAIELLKERFRIPFSPPPGEPITFIRTDYTNHGLSQVLEVDPDGSNLANVTHNSMYFDDTPAWSPDHSKIVFARATSGSSPQALWVMRADGTQQQQLTYPPAGTSDVEPRWSPDGTTIAFQRFYAIWLTNADGTNVRELPASQDPPAMHTMPSWNPNGTEIAFCRQSGGVSGIAVAQVNGAPGQYQMLTANPVLDAWPAWSPDGTKVAFSRNDGNAVRIWTIDPSGNTASEVALSHPDVSHIDQGPCWSPDGRRLAFMRWGGYPSTGEVWLMDADGANESNLTALNEPLHTVPPQVIADSFPNWG